MNIIRPSDLTVSQIIALLNTAKYPDEPVPSPRWVVSAFFEPSTRTKMSFHAAVNDSGYRVMDLPGSSSIVKGETEDDTIRNMLEIGHPRVAIIRSSDEELIHRMAQEYPEVRFINAGNGASHHPTQALGDLLTLSDHFQGWENLSGKTVTIIGDVRSSRVANSCKEVFEMFGMTVCVGGPQDFLPTSADWAGNVRIGSKREALERSDVIMTLRIQHERKKFPDDAIAKVNLTRSMKAWQITGDDLSKFPDLRIMHPGPVNRGVELTDDAVDGMQSLILRQVRAGYQMRRALFSGVI